MASSLISSPLETIVEFIEQFFGVVVNLSSLAEKKSAQQTVYILPVSFFCQTKVAGYHRHRDRQNNFLDTIRSCDYKIVLRIWRGNGKFWNLHGLTKQRRSQQHELVEFAKAEVAGYRISRYILTRIDTYDNLRDTACSVRDVRVNGIVVPEVLYFSHDTTAGKIISPNTPPWAIFSYVGKESVHFNNMNRINDQGTFVSQMVKVRHEFGFDEPHPRHGRVDSNRSLSYALQVLDQIIKPLHHPFYTSNNPMHASHLHGMHKILAFDAIGECYRYNHMVSLYHRISHDLLIEVQKRENQEGIYISVNPVPLINEQLIRHTHLLYNYTSQLTTEVERRGNQELHRNPPGVLCHCDLQPQNLMFFWTSISDVDTHTVPSIACVLDWEEAAYADPRFEIVLICRRVCCDINQARVVWDNYTRWVDHEFNHYDRNIIIGPLEPWLILEGLHNICIWLLQAWEMTRFWSSSDLGSSASRTGRNPWEDRKTLEGKIEREFQRFNTYGWNFQPRC